MAAGPDAAAARRPESLTRKIPVGPVQRRHAVRRPGPDPLAADATTTAPRRVEAGEDVPVNRFAEGPALAPEAVRAGPGVAEQHLLGNLLTLFLNPHGVEYWKSNPVTIPWQCYPGDRT